MESDALGVNREPKGTKRSSATMTSKRSLLATFSSPGVPTVLVCGLCVLSLTATGYFSYRETVLESRLGALEAQFAVMRATLGGGGGGDAVLQRLRREVETRFQHRMSREMANGRRLLNEAAASSVQLQQQHSRVPRDVSECICPPGKTTLFLICHNIIITIITAWLTSQPFNLLC
jgi:hypothetical protein